MKSIFPLGFSQQKTLSCKFVFRIMFHQIFWIQSPSKILSLEREDIRDGSAMMRDEMESQYCLLHETCLPWDSHFWLAYLVSFQFLFFNSRPHGQRLSLPSCSQMYPINNKSTCFVIVFQCYLNCLPYPYFFTMINIHTVLIQHLFSMRDIELMLIQVNRAQSTKPEIEI